MHDIEKLNEMIKECNHIVFFGGAGVSTASGIPDFRSSAGLYQTNQKYNPEEILSHHFYLKHPTLFYQFYFDKMIYPDAIPNDCHKKLVELENLGKLKSIITQNIDGLHTKAGSKNVLELHGSIYQNYCTKCNKFYNLNELLKRKNNPICDCGGYIKPNVVLYEEELNNNVLNQAIKDIQTCDMLLIGGTSLNVYPANGLIHYLKVNI